ncbi:hypothetical protein T4A_11365 [Trichinella pseudospiralis]|uniref:Transmembrane protein n=1 Tax=Trichinella pseudospiralis TaxID=6337 RepID=A0A0V1EE15_TRIPS|nr:hypothetical protein T4A_11365 [Trichinella pseudospiralis]
MQRTNKNGRKPINDFYDNSSINMIAVSDSYLPFTPSYRLLSRSSLKLTSPWQFSFLFSPPSRHQQQAFQMCKPCNVLIANRPIDCHLCVAGLLASSITIFNFPFINSWKIFPIKTIHLHPTKQHPNLDHSQYNVFRFCVQTSDEFFNSIRKKASANMLPLLLIVVMMIAHFEATSKLSTIHNFDNIHFLLYEVRFFSFSVQ